MPSPWRGQALVREQRLRGSAVSEAEVSERCRDKEARYPRSETVD